MYFYAEGVALLHRIYVHIVAVYMCTLSPLGEYYFPPKLLTAAAMRSYVKLRYCSASSELIVTIIVTIN